MKSSRLLLLAALAAASASNALAQIAYGVDATGDLFSFNLATPGSISSLGNLGFTPEAIDFRPGTSTLYAVNINFATGAGTLHTVNTTSGQPTTIGSGFTAAGLIGATSVGFDFNPTTLQADGSIRIRLVGNNGANFRLQSATGGIAATDTAINGVTGASITGAAYTRNDFASIGAVPTGTSLFYIDSFNNSLLNTSNPNGGVVGTVGALGFDVGTDVGFDILTGGSTNTAYLVDTTGTGAANLYTVNLTTGAAGPSTAIARDFTGGFAIDNASAIPEPSTAAALVGLIGLGFAALRRRR